MPTKSQHPETLVLHAGYRSDPATTAVAVPIYQTTSYQFRDSQHAANLFALAELANIYSRIMNPTNAVLEERVAALDGGVAALALASGQAASLFAVQNICQAGDNFVSSTDLYGGTWNLFLNTMMKTMGMEVRFVDPADPEGFRRATDARTRCYYAETLPNPKLEVFPIGEVARIGRELGAPMSPFNAFLFIQGLETLPLRMRAHSANTMAVTKFLAEHPKVTRVIHPSLITGEAKRRADAYLKGGYGGLVGFELQGGREAGARFVDALKMFYHVANIGDARSLAIHPASTTHSQLSPEEQLQTGVTDNYVRLSIGIEHEEDILADLSQALDAA